MKSFTEFINESGVTVQLGCHDLDKVEGYCATLRLSQAEVQSLISTTMTQASALAEQKVDEFVKDLIEMGGEDSKLIAKKFSSSIKRLKPGIIKSLIQHYPAAVRASAAMGPKIDVKSIYLGILKLVWDEFLHQWQSSWLERKAAAVLVDSSNITEVKRQSQEIFGQVLSMLGSQLDWFYQDAAWSPVRDLVDKKNKSSSQYCKQVLLTHDRGCNRLAQPVHPKLTYRIEWPTVDAKATGQVEREVQRAYWPKISALLDELV